MSHIQPFPELPGLLEGIEQDNRDQDDFYAQLRAGVAMWPPILGAAESAVSYAKMGLHVFPIEPESEDNPAGGLGVEDATDDVAQVRAWWEAEPDANIAIALGHVVDVLFVCDRDLGRKGWAALELCLPPILGRASAPFASHVYVEASGGRGGTTVADGVFWLGLGEYVLAPPSVNEDGIVSTWTQQLQIPEKS